MKPKTNIPPILLQKGYTEIVQINSNTNNDISGVYKVNRPGIGYWIVKRISKEFAVMYRTEKAILTSLRHDFLPIIFDVFEDEKALYIAMEFISGDSFKQLINEKIQISEADARKYFLQLCEIFEYLHIKGVIHKDCKPSNVMLSDQGNVHLIDFGVSKSGKYNPGGMSQLYASPEQIENPNIDDPRTDIYSLGATMYSLITQEPPSENIKRRRVMANISPKLRGIILKCMEPKPSNRYQSMTDLKKAITRKDWAWKTLSALMAMLIFAAVVFFAYFMWMAEVTNNLIARGDRLKSEGNYHMAMQHYETYVARRPTEPVGFERQRRLLIHRGEYSLAATLCLDEKQEKFFADSEFANTWNVAVSHAIVYYYQSENWDILLELLDGYWVQHTLDPYKIYSLRAYAATAKNDTQNAIYYYQQLLHYHYDGIAAYTHMQNLLNGAALAHGQDRYYFLSAAIGHEYVTSLTAQAYNMMIEHIATEVWTYMESGDLLRADYLLAEMFEKYPTLALEFELLHMRVAVAQRRILLGTDYGIQDLEYHILSALAAATENDTVAAEELQNLLEIIGEEGR